jgi:hypothetical protein
MPFKSGSIPQIAQKILTGVYDPIPEYVSIEI